MKRRRAGVVHANWDNFITRWSGCQRWWDLCEGWKSFVRVAQELCKRALTRKENKVTENWTKIYKQDEKSEQEEGRKKKIMKERNELRIWDPGW